MATRDEAHHLPLTGRSKVQYAWLDATPEPVVITDEEGRFLAANDAFERLFALTSAQLASEPFGDLIIASRFRSAYRAARRTALADERPSEARHTSELVAVHSDGASLPLRSVLIVRTSPPARSRSGFET